MEILRRGSQWPIILKETIIQNWNLLIDGSRLVQGNQITFHWRAMDIFLEQHIRDSLHRHSQFFFLSFFPAIGW